MKTIIAGSRTVARYEAVCAAIEASGFTITEVVSGTAKGPDSLGEVWAVNNMVRVKKFPADWDRYGKRAGFIRNAAMADYAEALIAVWDGQSRGTEHMIRVARNKGLKIYVYEMFG